MSSTLYRRIWVVVVAGVLPAAVGCYTYAPLGTSTGVQAGEHIAVEITDRGRAELGDRLGPGILRLEGTLTRTDTQDLVMNVWRVADIGGTRSRWNGESVRFRREYAARVETRTLNRTKTYLAVVGAVGAFAWFAASHDLVGGFLGGGQGGQPPPNNSSRGWWF
jgi:hypothetical protein